MSDWRGELLKNNKRWVYGVPLAGKTLTAATSSEWGCARVIPKEHLVVHGQRTCLPCSPRYPECPLLTLCPRVGLQ